MTLLNTLNYFIEGEQAELTDLEWQIKEETNYEDSDIGNLCEWFDLSKERLENLQKIKKLLIQHNLIGEE